MLIGLAQCTCICNLCKKLFRETQVMNTFLLKKGIGATKKCIFDFFPIENFFDFSIKFWNILCLDQS